LQHGVDTTLKALLTYTAGARVAPVVVSALAAVSTAAIFDALALTIKLQTQHTTCTLQGGAKK